MRERPVERKGAFRGPFALICGDAWTFPERPNGTADPSPEIFEDWEAIDLMRQNVHEDEPTVLTDPSRSATRTERDECFDMLEQVETGRLF